MEDIEFSRCIAKILKTSQNRKRFRNRMNHIPLQKLPITVGKMAGAVDLVLNDQSVSRLHARISRDGNRFFITDLNSTNGTFRNGMRLEPNASEIIEPGDEIGIGKLKFIYR